MQSSRISESRQNCDIIPSCFDCVRQPDEIAYESFFCNGKGKRHWIHTGVCPEFIPDYGSYAELLARYPELGSE